jgi:sugar phosphate isomerase/epimerase
MRTPNQVSFTSVNLVTQETNWHMDEWNQADEATNAACAPIEAFADKFDAVVATAKDLGFDYLDLWTAHLNPLWATEEHLAAAKEILRKHGITALAMSGGMGDDWRELEKIVAVADQLGLRALAGPSDAFEKDPASTVALLKDAHVKLALENHPLESTPEEMLRKLKGQDVVMTTIDTGWWGTVGADPVRAIHVLKDVIFCAHLKDVKYAGEHHDNCPWGEGIVPVRECFDGLMEIGYSGPITVEYEPDDGDPREPVRAMLAQLLRWQAGTA